MVSLSSDSISHTFLLLAKLPWSVTKSFRAVVMLNQREGKFQQESSCPNSPFIFKQNHQRAANGTILKWH